jgi:hypothetical protein
LRVSNSANTALAQTAEGLCITIRRKDRSGGRRRRGRGLPRLDRRSAESKPWLTASMQS